MKELFHCQIKDLRDDDSTYSKPLTEEEKLVLLAKDFLNGASFSLTPLVLH